MTVATGLGQEWRYPSADRDDVVETRHGTAVADPYRWLEDPHSARTRRWMAAQNELSEAHLASLPTRPWFTACLSRLLGTPRAGVPHQRGGRYLVSRNDGTREQDRVHVADDLAALVAGGRVLIDPAEFSPDGRVSLTGVSLSPDARWVVYGVSEAGGDWTTWRVREVATGADTGDRVTRSKFLAAEWLPDASGFLYWGYPESRYSNSDDPSALGVGALLCHRLGADQRDDGVVHHDPTAPRELAFGEFTDDGRWLVTFIHEGTDRRNRVAVRRVGPGGSLGPRRDVVAERYAQFDLAGSDEDVLYLRTDHGTERFRLVAVDLAGLAGPISPADADRSAWREVVGENAAVLASIRRAGDGFVAVYLDDASHRVQLLGRDGSRRGEVALAAAEPVAVVATHGRAGEDDLFIGVTTFVTDTRCYRVDLASGASEELPLVAPPAGTAAPVTTERRHATSPDGTIVPYFLVRRSDRPADGPRPTLLYGYGGFNQAMTPVFKPAWPAWVEAGGVLVVANLRGGGEFGRAWYEAGRRERKQQVFDDFAAVADDLVATGVTSRDQLALHGRSNGGLLVAAVMTQRPDLAAVALPMVGVMDMLRFHEFTIGWAWTPDLGDPEVAEDFVVLRAYSPLHNLHEGVDYPATLVLTGDHDDRAVPAHSYKFAAQLQHVDAGVRPVLVRIDLATGHGVGKPRAALVAETADMLAFAAAHTGLAPE